MPVKLRLESAPLTEEDRDIWLRVAVDFGAQHGFHCLDLFLRCADRRDADLMFMASDIAKYGPCAVQLFGIDCRGWSQEPDWTDRVRASPP